MSEGRFGYPIFLDLSGQAAVVVGGGRVAARKAEALAEAGARVRVVAPEMAAAIEAEGRYELVRESYDAKHLAGARIVVASTDDETVNARVAADARAAGAWVNVVDRPELCDFIVPARIQRGDLVVAVTTGGAAPSLSRRLRERFESEFGPEYADLLAAARRVRGRLKAEGADSSRRRRIFERLTEPEALAAARRGPEALEAFIDRLLREEAPPS